jgi:MOSC domain-containing protein YiiM
MFVVSVQAGQPSTLDTGRSVIQTGIRKQPIAKGRFEAAGVIGDNVVNTVHHGGVDQAVYVYSAEDYAWWQDQLDRVLPPGIFGDNLLLSTFGDGPVRVGDRYTIGDVVLEVTSPRIPCGTFSAVMEIDDWLVRFRDARRPGFYARVLADGMITTGDAVARNPASASNVDILELQDIYYDKNVDADRLARAAASPIAERARADLVKRLGRV